MQNNTLSSAIKKIAVSYIFIYFGINISVIDILPDWLGYFMIVSALPILSEKEQSAGLLKPFGITIGICNIISWALKIADAPWNLTLISLLLSIITIYFHFQLITNIASLDIEHSKRKRLLALRTTTVLLHTVLTLSLFIPTTIDNEVYSYILMFLALVQSLICIWIVFELFGLAKSIKDNESEIPEVTEEFTDIESGVEQV